MVLILFSGRPLTVPWAFEHVPAVIAAWLPGIAGGPALARTLFGEVNPSGKLVVSWPRSVGQEPLYYNRLDTGRPPSDVDLTHPPTDIVSRYVSRYIDEQNTPQFPFGYGGSYTSFNYGATTISTRRLSAATLNKSMAAGTIPVRNHRRSESHQYRIPRRGRSRATLHSTARHQRGRTSPNAEGIPDGRDSSRRNKKSEVRIKTGSLCNLERPQRIRRRTRPTESLDQSRFCARVSIRRRDNALGSTPESSVENRVSC